MRFLYWALMLVGAGATYWGHRGAPYSIDAGYLLGAIFVLAGILGLATAYHCHNCGRCGPPCDCDHCGGCRHGPCCGQCDCAPLPGDKA